MLQFPSLDRDWSDDGKILASVSIEGDLVRVKNVRDFDYRSTTDYTPNYYDAVYDTRQIVRAWYIIEPFGGHDGPAHTMLAFDFDDGQFVTVSAEIRKEVGESFDAIK